MAKINFRSIAEESMTLSRLHNGREKLETSDVVGKPLTIEEFDTAVSNDGKVFAVFTFKEMPKKYYNGGLILTKMVNAWAAEFDGDVELANQEYINSKESVVIKLKEAKAASSKNNITLVELV